VKGWVNLLAPKGGASGEARLRVKAWTLEALGLGQDAVVSVTELTCAEPGCPPVETVLAVFDPSGPTRLGRIHKATRDLTEADVIAAFAGPSTRSSVA